MVASEDDNSVLVEFAVFEELHQLPNLIINEAARCEVSSTGTLDRFFRDRMVQQIDTMHNAPRVSVLLLLWNGHFR